MQWHLKELIGRYESRNPNDSMSYRRIEAETGISKTAINKIATNKATRIDIGTLNTLLNYFSEKLKEDLDIPDLLHYRKDQDRN